MIQYNEYYPFGLQTSNSWTRSGSKNDYLYNSGTELNGTSGWYETMFRGYDAALGRFLQVDALAAGYADWTPYAYANNNPVRFNDPTGLSTEDYEVEEIRRWMNRYGGPRFGGEEGPYSWGSYSTNEYIQGIGGGSPDIYNRWCDCYVDAREVLAYRGEGQNQVYRAQAQAALDEWLWQQTQGNEPFGFSPGSDSWNAASNYMTEIGMSVDGAAFSLGRALDKRLAYSPRKTNFGKWMPKSLPPGPTRIAGLNVPTGLVKGAANTLKVGGAVLGGVGLLMTGAEIYNGEKSLIGEGGLDLIMGGVAFIPGGGWIASGLYFGGKWALEATGNDFWNK